MDPDAALINLRAAINAALIEQSPDHDSVDAIAEHFEALDGWLSRGGFLPSDWHRD